MKEQTYMHETIIKHKQLVTGKYIEYKINVEGIYSKGVIWDIAS